MSSKYISTPPHGTVAGGSRDLRDPQQPDNRRAFAHKEVSLSGAIARLVSAYAAGVNFTARRSHDNSHAVGRADLETVTRSRPDHLQLYVPSAARRVLLRVIVEGDKANLITSASTSCVSANYRLRCY